MQRRGVLFVGPQCVVVCLDGGFCRVLQGDVSAIFLFTVYRMEQAMVEKNNVARIGLVETALYAFRATLDKPWA